MFRQTQHDSLSIEYSKKPAASKHLGYIRLFDNAFKILNNATSTKRMMRKSKSFIESPTSKWLHRLLIVSILSTGACKSRTECKIIKDKKICTTTHKNGDKEKCITYKNKSQYCETRYPNGKIASRGSKKSHYGNSLRKDGVWIWKYKNGNSKKRCTYTARSSDCKTWYEDGKKASERINTGYFRNNVFKLLKWDWSGKLITDCQTKNKKLICKIED